MAEREGFEPSNGYQPLHDFQSCALDQLSHLSAYLTILLYHNSISLSIGFLTFYFGKRLKYQRSAQIALNFKKTLDKDPSLWYNNRCISRCVGIGRRGGLKIHCQRWRAGSSPATGTRQVQPAYLPSLVVRDGILL